MSTEGSKEIRQKKRWIVALKGDAGGQKSKRRGEMGVNISHSDAEKRVIAARCVE